MEGHFTFPCKAVVNFTMLQIWFFFVNNRMKSSAIFTSSLVCTLLCQVSEDTFLQYQVILTFFWKYLLGRLKKIGFKNRKDSTNTQNEHQFLKRQNRIWFEDCERRAPTQLLAGAEFFSLLRSVKLFQKIKKFTVFLYLYLKLCLMKIINKYKL